MTAHIERDGSTLVMRASSGDTWLLPLGGNRYLDRLYGGTVTFEDGKITWSFGNAFVAKKVFS